MKILLFNWQLLTFLLLHFFYMNQSFKKMFFCGVVFNFSKWFYAVNVLELWCQKSKSNSVSSVIWVEFWILESCTEQHLENRLRSVKTTILTSQRENKQIVWFKKHHVQADPYTSGSLSSLLRHRDRESDNEKCECVKVWRPKCIRHADSHCSLSTLQRHGDRCCQGNEAAA